MRIPKIAQAALRPQVLLLIAASALLTPAWGGIIAPNLGTAASFGLLGGTISNTGTSVVIGNVGATTTITGFPPGTAPCCTVYPFPSDPTVQAAYGDFLNAFNSASALPATQTLADLTSSRVFLSDNVYRFTNETAGDLVSTAGITLTFSGPDVFIIEVTRDLTIHGDITFNLVNGAVANNIYWVVGRTATFDPTSTPLSWQGDVLAGTSFTMSANTGGSGVLAGTVNGCVFAETANTLAGQSVINGCGTSTASTPEPGTSGMVGLACAAGLFFFGVKLIRES
jgi:hypothetical protein